MSARLTGRARLVLAGLGCVLLVGGIGLAAWGLAAPNDAEVVPLDTPATPLWSVRRAPDLVREYAGRDVLTRELGAPLVSSDHCVAVVDDEEVLAEIEPGRSLVPASAQKLLTGAGTIDALGPDGTLTTSLLTVDPPAGSVIDGDLYLLGGGDPTVGTESYATFLGDRPRYDDYPVTPIDQLADELASQGVRTLTGSVIGDDTRHSNVRYLPSWKSSYRTDGQSGPLSSLVANGGFRAVGGRVGVAEPAAHAALVLTEALELRGILVSGAPRAGVAPADAELVASVTSAPVETIVAGLIGSSDNLTAELLTREVAVASGMEGSTDLGTDEVERRLAELGVPVEGVDLVDGSGLSPDNRATCRALVAALELGDEPGFSALDDGLSIAGETGTLAQRLTGHPLSGVLRAKTGQIAGVVGLAGVVETPRAPTFAFLANGDFSQAEGNEYQVVVAQAIAAFPRVPAAEDLVPLP